MKNKKSAKKLNLFNLRSSTSIIFFGLPVAVFSFLAVSGYSASQVKLAVPGKVTKISNEAGLASTTESKSEKTDSILPPSHATDETPVNPEQSQVVTSNAGVEKKTPTKQIEASITQTQQNVTAEPTPTVIATTPVDTSGSVTFINSLRTSLGKPALTPNATMNSWALAHANTLASQCTLYHQALGSFLNQNIGATTIKSIAENVGYASTVSAVLENLKNSSGHYENMTGDYSYVGIGVVVAGGSCAGYVYTTQMFAK